MWKKEGKRKENNGIMVARFETENKGVEIMPREILGEEFFTIEETGKILGLSKVAVRDMLKRKRIEGRKIGTRWYFTKKDMKAFLDRKSPPPGSIEEGLEDMGL